MKTGLTAITLALATLSLAACGGSSEIPATKASLPQGETLPVRSTDIDDLKAVSAEITTQDQAEALARIPGILVSLSVREGDIVHKGQRIGTIVDSRIGYETAAYQSQAAAAQAEAARAAGELQRIRALYSENVYSKARLEQAEASAKAAQAQVSAARAQMSASSSLAGQGALIAPADGRVLRADIPQGAAVAPGMSIATITAGNPVLKLDLPESLFGQVRLGTAVRFYDPDHSDTMIEAKVSQIYPGIMNGRFRADAKLPRAAGEAIGRRVTARIAVGKRQGIVIPRRFITTQFGIDYVTVVAKDNALSSVPVQVAAAAEPDKVEVLSGVTVGDTVFAGKRPQ